jgi:cytochrome c oxidase subunit 2
LHLPPQASSIAFEVDNLHYFIAVVTGVVALALAIITTALFVRYKYRGKKQIGEHYDPGLNFEVAIISAPMFFFLLWFGMGFKTYVKMESTPANAMEVYVMGKKWMWKFAYPEGPNSVGVLRIPVGRPVKLLMTSRDVIHDVFIPAFRLKKDVLPGRYTEMWFTATEPGTYELFCAEYCGTGHSMMRGSVIAMKPDEFDAWLQAQKNVTGAVANAQDTADSPDEKPRVEASMVLNGQRIAGEKGCLKCHSVDGTPHIGPTWLGLYHRKEKLSTGEIQDVDEAYLTDSMMDPNAKLVAGYQPVMPTFQGRLAAPDSAAIVEYIKSLRAPELQAQPSEGPSYEPSRR